MTTVDRTWPALTLPPDLPPPPVPGFVHEHCRDRFDGPAPGAALPVALGAVLARRAGTGELALGFLDRHSGEPMAVRATVTDDTSLAGLAAALGSGMRDPAPLTDAVRVVCLAGDDDRIAARLVDRDLVLRLDSAGSLDCAYDPDRYRPDSVRTLLADVRAVLGLLATAPDTPLAALGVTASVVAPESKQVPVAVPARAEPPGSRTERAIARIWGDVLDLADVGRDENFFALGGHSLLAVRVAVRMREVFDVELPVDQLFATPTVRAAAECVRAHRGRRRAPVPPPGPAPAGAPAAVSASQERIWFFENWSPGTAAYHQPWALELRGRLDADALAAAVADVVARHEILRTTFVAEDGRPVPVCRAELTVELRRHDLAGGPEPRARADALLAGLARAPFDLAAGPLVRCDLLRLGVEEHVLLLTLHHLVNDGWSLEVLLGELAACYDARLRGAAPDLPPPPLRYADVAAWQRSALRGEVADEAVDHFARELRGAPALLELPTDRPRPPVPSYAGATVEFALPEELTWSVRQLARERGTTPFVVLLAAFQALLHRYSGQADVVVGTTCANRDRPELEDLLGPFFNSLALRASLGADPTFAELVEQARRSALGAFARQEVPFETVVDRLAPQRDPSRSPLFQVLLELADPPAGAPPAGLAWTSRLIDTGTSKLDLTLTFTDAGESFAGLATYSTDLFDPATVHRLLGNFHTLLADACAEPDTRVSALAVVAESDRALIAAVNDTGRPYDTETTVHQRFQRQAASTPDALAVRCADRRLSFAELNALANRLAWRLRADGVGPEVPVAICLDRSVDMLVAMLGVLKAGGAYVPIDPAYPAERKRLLAATTDLLVGWRSAAGDWHDGPAVWLDAEPLDGWPAEDPPATARADNLAYVIYTSGSTGAPKGVLVAHGGLVNYLDWCVSDYVAGATGGAPVFSSYAFDMLVPNIYAPLVCGQPVHLLPADANPAELGELLAAGAPYAFVKLTPGHLDLLAEQLTPALAAALCRTLVVGADAFPSRALAAWRRLDPDTVVLNEYGPTEASVANCVLRTGPGIDRDLVPIGRPIPNTAMHVLDAGLRPVPVGVPGELYIGGDCVVRGYHGRPALTAQRFLPDPFAGAGARMYRTGDLGRLLPDGNFEFLGRADDQVKIDGFRVEPGEIEATLAQHAGIRQAAVLAVPDNAGVRRLVGYVVPAAERAPDHRALRGYLAERLPRHLVPTAFVAVPAIPLNTNGKVDRAALPAPDFAAAPEAPPDAEPSTAVQRVLRSLWSEVLDRPERGIGVGDDFFGLGGRSLDVIRLTSRIRDTLRVRVSAAVVFRAPTIAALAESVTAAENGAGMSERIAAAVLRARALTPHQRAELLRRHHNPG